MTIGKSRFLALLAIIASTLMMMGGNCIFDGDDGDCIGIVCDDD